MGKPTITTEDFTRAANKLKCDVAAIKAVSFVESRGEGFYPDGFPVILFERHIFRKYTQGRYNKSHPLLSGPQGNYGKAGQNQRNKFNQAFALNPDAAMKACSWGKFQIMGFNYEICGFVSVGSFVDAMKESEGRHLDAFVNFVIGNHLAKFLKNLDWASFANGYNGSAYKINKYDSKMAAAYTRYSKASAVSSQSPAALASLPANAMTPGEQTDNPSGEPPPIDQAPIEPAPVVDVPIIAAQKEETVDDKISRWSARWMAIPTALTAGLGGAWSFLTSSPTSITITLIVAACLVAAIYFGLRQIAGILKARRDDAMKLAREKMAHETQLLLLQSAANKDSNTVRLVTPPPVVNLPNSDAGENQ